jgi:hypothetical protein
MAVVPEAQTRLLRSDSTEVRPAGRRGEVKEEAGDIRPEGLQVAPHPDRATLLPKSETPAAVTPERLPGIPTSR